jgi:ABC-2 type transport system permease protein
MTVNTTEAASIAGSPRKSDDYYSAREQRLQRGGRLLQLGALLNGLMAVLVFIVGVIAATSSTDLFTTSANITVVRYDGADDLALLLTLLLLLGNVCVLLLTFVSVVAQEFWGLLLVWAVAVVNVGLLVVYGFIPGLVSIVLAFLAAIVVTRDIRTFRINPVMLKEIRGRMRGARAFVVITVYLGLMSGFAVLMYLLQRGIILNSSTSTTGELGRSLFEGVFVVELLLIIFITPAFTSGAISNEQERRTFDLLQITLLSKAAFVVGKLESALSYVFLLLLAAIPLQSIAFIFGGVSENELALIFVILSTTALTLGAIGMFFSTTSDRTLTASVRAYTVTAIVTIGVPVVMWFFVNVFNHAVDNTSSTVTNSPSLEAFFMYIGLFVASLNPVLAASATQQLLINQQELVFWQATLNNGEKIPMIAPWISMILIYMIVSLILVIISVRRMRRADTV